MSHNDRTILESLTLSIIIPCFNGADTIGSTLNSIFGAALPEQWRLDVIVIDDGSLDGEELVTVIKHYPNVRLLRHETNLGMCAGRNTGIKESNGDVVIVLDADDWLVSDWPQVFGHILKEWDRERTPVCFSVCRTPDERLTTSTPGYRGLFTLEDQVNERYSGEYLNMFEGEYIRKKGYIDLKTRKSCSIVSYLSFAQDAPLWITPYVLRIYRDQRIGSVTYNWAKKEKARETAYCYQILFEHFGDDYRTRAPYIYRTKHLRYAVYLKLAELPGAWKIWLRFAHVSCWKESLAALMMLILGRRFTVIATRFAKNRGILRSYG